jgi:hypothetical protein
MLCSLVWAVACGGAGTLIAKAAPALGDPVTLVNTTYSFLPYGKVGTAYAVQLGASGGTPPYSWALQGGSLPPGLALSPAGAITGTPTAAGDFEFSVVIRDSADVAQVASSSFTLPIAANPEWQAPAPVAITTASLPEAQYGTAYSVQFTATGGVAPYRWFLEGGSLPSGLGLSSDGGLTGVPAASGEWMFTVGVQDGSATPQSAAAAFRLSVAAEPAPSLAVTPLAIAISAFPGAQQFVPYSMNLPATGGTAPYVWSLGGGTLPSGLNLDPAGTVAGTPTGPGEYLFQLGVRDSASPPQAAFSAFSIVVAPAPAVITTSTLPSGTQGVSYSAVLRGSGGTPPYAWLVSSGQLPPGLTLEGATGVLSGTPQSAGTYSFSVAMSDTAGAMVTAPLQILVSAASSRTFSKGIWISKEEIAALPTSGAAWDNLKAQADKSCGIPDLANQDDLTNVCILAKALVFARTDAVSYRRDVAAALAVIANSSTYSGRALALGRELAAYVISADLIDLKSYDETLDVLFRKKLAELLRTPTIDGPTSLIQCHELRPNNRGTHCGASRIAVDLYLGDQADLERAATVFRGYLGDRSAYAGFKYGSDAASWSPNPSDPGQLVGINPLGATRVWNGTVYNLDGALVDDIRRGCAFQWEPCHTGYPWEGLAGAVVQAEMLYRAGYPAYEWQDQALRRAYQYLLFLHNVAGGYWFDNGTTSGDDSWQPWIANKRYGIHLPAVSPSRPGKAMGWSDWTHAQ